MSSTSKENTAVEQQDHGQENQGGQGKQSPEEIKRGRFLTLVSLGLTGFATTVVALPVIGSFLGSLLVQPPAGVWRRLGKVDDFKRGGTLLVSYENAGALPWGGVSDKSGAWLRRNTDDSFIAFSVNCQHLGCPVRWVSQAELFECPCHGGIYYADGSVAAGPPPKSLQKYPVRVRSGHVDLFTSPIPLPGLSKSSG